MFEEDVGWLESEITPATAVGVRMVNTFPFIGNNFSEPTERVRLLVVNVFFLILILEFDLISIDLFPEIVNAKQEEFESVLMLSFKYKSAPSFNVSNLRSLLIIGDPFTRYAFAIGSLARADAKKNILVISFFMALTKKHSGPPSEAREARRRA